MSDYISQTITVSSCQSDINGGSGGGSNAVPWGGDADNRWQTPVGWGKPAAPCPANTKARNKYGPNTPLSARGHLMNLR